MKAGYEIGYFGLVGVIYCLKVNNNLYLIFEKNFHYQKVLLYLQHNTNTATGGK